MKAVYVVVLALCAVAYAFPRPDSEDTEKSKKDDPSTETELVDIPAPDRPSRPWFVFSAAPQDPFGQDPFFRRPFGQPSPVGGEVDDFMTQMQDMLREMRKQLTDLVKHAHEHGAIDGDDTAVGTRIGEGERPQNKTTSTTKVIDGHVVTINETTYSSGDDTVDAVLRVKVVEIHPSESPETEVVNKPEEPASSGTSNPKSELDESHETNEIPNQSQKVNYEWYPEFDPSFNEIDDQEDFSYQRYPPAKKENYYNLNDDTKVNDYLSDQAVSQGLVMIDPDAEIIDTNANSYYHYDRTPQRLQRFDY